jgi:exodeoxyribonuclease V beta subunit
MTNYLHIAELVQARAHQGDAGMEILVTWLATMRAAGADDLEEAQLRLESDADRVKIITMHGAKGLEYPIVFCPFAWDGKLRAGDGEEVLFHDPAVANRATIDPGSGQRDKHCELARREEFSEFVRLLYVALTRAAQRCYVYWGAMNDAGTSPLAWLLHHAPKIEGDGWSTGELVDRFCALSDMELLADLESVRKSQPEGIDITSVDPSITPSILRRVKDASTTAQALPFERPLSRSWRVDSFTGLSVGGADESPDHDGAAYQSVDVEHETAAEQSIHRYPRGARTGLCWHAVFENIDFVGLDGEVLHDMVMKKLAQSGIDPAWAPATEAMVRNTLDVTLDTATGLRLNGIDTARRINELGFFFSVSELRAPTLAEVLRQYGGSRAVAYADSVQRLSFEPLNGFLRGFIDLIFEHEGRYYLLDYKSNFLGPSTSHYAREHLEGAMRRNGYYLQYLLYTIALHRYLRLRIPDYRYDHHFGGVYYLFLRGITSSGDSGIYFDKPPETLINALDDYFTSGSTS